MKSIFARMVLATSFTATVLSSSALAEKFSVTFEGKIESLEEMDLEAPQSLKLASGYSYTVQFDTSDYVIEEPGHKRDKLSFVSGELVIGDISAKVNSAQIELFAKQDGADILTLESAELSDSSEELNLDWIQLRITPPNSDFAQDGNTLSEVFQNLSQLSDYGFDSWVSLGFVGATNKYGAPFVGADAQIESVSFTKVEDDEPNLKGPILSNEEVAALGSGLLSCLKDDQFGWERSHAERTRNEDFLLKLSPSFIDEIEKRAAENNATYRVVSVGFERKVAPFFNFAYFLILEREDGSVLVTPEYQIMGGTEYKKLDGTPCSPGAWAAPLSAYMKEKPNVETPTEAAFQVPSGQSVRSDLVGIWQCEGQGESENKGIVEEWSSATKLELMPDGKFQRTMSFVQGDDSLETEATGHWYADDGSVTVAASFQNVEELIVDGKAVSKLLLALGSLADGILGTNKKQVFEVSKRGLFWSKLTLEEKGDLPATCELLDG